MYFLLKRRQTHKLCGVFGFSVQETVNLHCCIIFPIHVIAQQSEQGGAEGTYAG
jgi:hypothetical protein